MSILLLSEDDARGKALAKTLRDQRARVGEMGASARDGARGVDLAVVDARSELSCAAQLSALRADVRGRWASVVTIDFTQLVKGDGSVLLASLAERVAPLVEADQALTARARAEESFKTALSPLGPPRTLRALSLSGHTLFVELRTKTLDALIEVSNELLVSASATRGEKRWEAWAALVRILGLSECEITVSRRAFTSFMNIMEPVDQALEVAAQERQCSADAIAAEEAEAEVRGTGSHRAPPKAAALPAQPPPAPGTLGGAPARPSPPARPAGSLGQQRTLMGVMPGLPSPGIAANDVRALSARPGEPAKLPEAPRYAHRHMEIRSPSLPAPGAGKAGSMTLMGVAPSAIPGLAELRAQRAEKAEPRSEARGAQREALQSALKEALDFDPPTVRHVASIPDLTDDLPDLVEDFSRAAQSLSSPLPTPASERDDEREPRPGMTFDDDDSQEQTIVASSQLTEELLARALESAVTDRPPPEAKAANDQTNVILADLSGEPATARQYHSMERPSVKEHELEEVLPISEPPPPAQEPASEIPDPIAAVASDSPSDFGPGEETLVVHRKSEQTKSRGRVIAALAGLAAILAIVFYAALKPSEAAPARAPESAIAVKPVQPSPAPKAVEPAAPLEPAVPSQALVPLAEPAAEAPEQAVEAPVEKAAAEAAEPARAEEPRVEAADVKSEEPVVEAAPIEEAQGSVAAAKEGTERSGTGTGTSTGGGENGREEQVSELLKKGQRLLAQRDAAGARPVLEQALALQSDNPHVRVSLAEALLKLNELPLALAQAQTAVKLRPKRGRYLVLQGNVLAAMGKADDARAAFQRAYQLDPNDAEAKRKAGL